jgi:NitT/TauT family transport system permease protein
MSSKQIERWSPLVLLLVLVALWQGVCVLFAIPEFIFPAPTQIAQAMSEFSGPIAEAAWKTFWVTMVGFGISIVVGVLLGFLVGSSRLAYAAVYPLLVAFNAVPKAAIVPILIVWFGIGVGPGILTALLWWSPNYLIRFSPMLRFSGKRIFSSWPSSDRWPVILTSH